MPLLVVGLVLFLSVHSLRELGLRERLIASLGSRRTYLVSYSLLSLAGLVLIVVGKSEAGFLMVWQPWFEWRNISHMLMLPALILVVAGNVPVCQLRAKLRNPMLLGTFLWGVAHLWANGDLASMVLFGSFTLWSAIKFVNLWIHHTPPARPARLRWDMVAIVLGVMLYGVVLVYHGQLFGVGLTI